MSSFIIKWIANRFLKDNQWNRLGVEDPYYEHLPLNAEGTKTKKIARRVPDGLGVNDTKVLNTVRKKAYRYDMWFSFLGVKFGWSNLVGIVPIAGPIVSAYWSLSLLMTARKLDDGLPLDIQGIFITNIVIDFLLGLIPIVGDLIEIGYKANLRNFLLLEKHLYRVGQKNLGNIDPDEVRPGFINDKVQPVLEEKIIPGTAKVGKQIGSFVSNSYNNLQKQRVKPGTKQSSTATTHTSAAEVISGNKADINNDTDSARTLSETLKKFD